MSIDVARDCGGAAEVQTSSMCMCAQCVRFLAFGNSNAVFFLRVSPLSIDVSKKSWRVAPFLSTARVRISRSR